MTVIKVKWSRRRWLAETIGCDLADVTEYQSNRAGPEGRLPIFDTANGSLYCVQLAGDAAKKLAAACDGYTVKQHKCWRDESVIVHELISSREV
jgi:hypothetical protein